MQCSGHVTDKKYEGLSEITVRKHKNFKHPYFGEFWGLYTCNNKLYSGTKVPSTASSYCLKNKWQQGADEGGQARRHL